MIRNLLFTAAVLSVSACAPVVADESHYACKKSIFGCYTEYVGPKNSEAAEEYLKDAEQAVAWTVDAFDDVQAVHFNLDKGEVVIQMKPMQRLDNKQVSRIADYFLEHRLHITAVILMNNDMRMVIGGKNVLRKNGGSSRFFALNDYPVDAAVKSAGDDVKKAFSSVRSDQWGNFSIRY